MSTNPFRRSSLKGPGGSNSSNSNATLIADESGRGEIAVDPLSIDTRVPSSTQKHVNFASPPAVPISPASYPPSSPESLRISPALVSAQPIAPNSTDYSGAIQSDPFHAEAEPDEDDGPIQQALRNTKANAVLVARNPHQEKEEAVKRTLSKFASAPRKPPNNQKNDQDVRRQTLDVDAFKRLLLTGDSGQEDPKTLADGVSSTSLHAPSDDSSSDEDSLSSEQDDSPHVNVPFVGHSSTTSVGTDRQISNANVNLMEGHGKMKPPPPKSRHGKSLIDASANVPSGPDERPKPVKTTSGSSLDVGSSPTDTANSSRRAPPPPLSRRKSQKSPAPALGPTATRQSPAADHIVIPARSESGTKTIPPPPPSRRPNSVIVRPHVSDPSVSESAETPSPPHRQPSDAQPSLAATTSKSGTKRMSMGNIAAPPAPPPRRGRASSRSSVDSPRLAPAILSGNAASTRSSSEYVRPETVDENTLSTSNAHDILADLAALQQEVDAARRITPK